MYRNNNINQCQIETRGGTVDTPCGIPTSTGITNADNFATDFVGSNNTTTSPLCPVRWEDHYNGVWGGFCNWKSTFKATFLGKPNPCNFLEKRRLHLQNKLNGFIANGTNPLWQEQLTYKLGFIQFLGFNYGCYTSSPTNTNPQARISATPQVKQRRVARRTQNFAGMKSVNRNIYNI